MSIEAQRLVRAVDELTAAQKAVLAAYAFYADADGCCWAGTVRIGRDTALSLATVGRVRRDLIRRGWLTSRRRLGTSSVTWLNLDRIAEAGIDTGPHRPRRGPRPERSATPAAPATSRLRRRSPQKHGRSAEPPAPATNPVPAAAPVAALAPAPLDLPPAPVATGRAQSAHGERTEPLTVSALPGHCERESVREPSGDLSLDARETPGRAGAPVGDRSERASETASPNPDPADLPAPTAAAGEPEAWAVELIADLDYGPHRRPTQARARTLATKLVAAHASGLSQRDLRRHCRAALNQARRNGVAYLDGALHPDHLPIPAPDTGPITAPAPAAAPGAGAADDRPTSPAGPADPAPMDRAHAQAEIRRILTRRRPDVGPETPTDARTTATPTDHPSTTPARLNGAHSAEHGHTPTASRYRRRLYRRR